jgi:rubredoxin
MMPPHKKRVASVTPEAWGRGMRLLIERLDGRVYDEERPCPRCGSEGHHRLGTRERLYAKLLEGEGFKDVKVRLQRFRCKACRHVYTAEGAFYPDCLYGREVVDLAVYLAAGNPFNRVEALLMSAGIQVDRDTVKRWVKLFIRRSLEAAPITIFGVNVAVNALRLMYGEDLVEEVREEMGHATFLADETFEAVLGARRAMEEENRRREEEGVPPLTVPESWTVATAYLVEARTLASLLVTGGAMNLLLARAVTAPTAEGDLVVTDGNPAYNVVDRVICVNHAARNGLRGDAGWRRMRRQAPREEREAYAKALYARVREEAIDGLRETHPQLFDGEGGFQSWVTTNPLEGMNRRLHYEIRVAYLDREAIFGRELLIGIMDSLYTFRHGRPEVSFGASRSSFTLGDVMAHSSQEPIPSPDGQPPGMEASLVVMEAPEAAVP